MSDIVLLIFSIKIIGKLFLLLLVDVDKCSNNFRNGEESNTDQLVLALCIILFWEKS